MSSEISYTFRQVKWKIWARRARGCRKPCACVKGPHPNRKDLAMRYRTLGRSGLIVSELCLGTMTFGGGEGMWRVVGQLQQDEADALVKASLDAGINFIDTANVYSEGQSEAILGQS